MKCPKCERDDQEFRVVAWEIYAGAWFINNEGDVLDAKDMETFGTGIYPDGECRCAGCGHIGHVREFTRKKKIADLRIVTEPPMDKKSALKRFTLMELKKEVLRREKPVLARLSTIKKKRK